MGKTVKPSFFIGFVALIVFDTSGQLGFKFAGEAVGPLAMDIAWFRQVLAEPAFYMTLGAYLGAFVVYMGLLKDAAVGPLFAASHAELITVTLISVTFFGEKFTFWEAAGCILILGGIVLLGLSEGEESHP